MLEYVRELLNQEDNIIDQLNLLKQHSDNEEVQKYMDALTKINNSPYFQYCIDKYYLEKDVKEVDPPLPKLYSTWEATKYILDLLDKEDNIIDQLKLLRTQKNDKRIDNYLLNLMAKDKREFVKYCIKKYYFQENLEPLQPDAKNLKITLYPIIFDTQKSYEETETKNRPTEDVKINDKIKITDGKYLGLEGIVSYIDKSDDKIIVEVELFGKLIFIELQDSFIIIN